MLTKDLAEKRKKWNSWGKFNNRSVFVQYVNMNRLQFV
jgi:hypothetical protein